MLLNITLLAAGLTLLIWSANKLVDGSSALAARFNVPNMVIGLTIVAFGTSTPELIISGLAAYQGQSAIAIGNVLGSNIFNILGIIGITAVITTIPVRKWTTLFEVPLTLAAAVIVLITYYLGSASTISRWEGGLLVAGFVIFAVYIATVASRQPNSEEVEIKAMKVWMSIVWILIGFGGLIFGGNLLVDNAVEIASRLGVSERVIAITIISIGTSLPELVTSVVAAYKKNLDMAIGNVIGSCIFNTFLILGVAALISPITLQPEMLSDIWVNIISCLAIFAFIFIGKGRQIERWEGGFLLLIFIGYIYWLL